MEDPKLIGGFSPSNLVSPRKIARMRKSCKNFRLTVICGFMTILILRGMIGGGKFGTPEQDIHEISQRIDAFHRKDAVRGELLEEPIGELLEEPIAAAKPYALGPKVSDWDAQRTKVTAHSGDNRRGRILLVTGSQPDPCHNPAGDHYLVKSIKNKIDYCRLHSMEIFYNTAHLDSEMPGVWAKLPLIRKLMISHPEIEWMWWMDSDALFTDMEFELPMDKYRDFDLVLHGWDDRVYRRRSWVGLNTGSFLLRNCQWSLELLDAWATMGPRGSVRAEAGKLLTQSLEGRPDFEADDQSALVYLLANERARWGPRVHLENSYYLHGYWAIIVERFEEWMVKNRPGTGDERWPFVTHFVGCKPCGKRGDYPVERCLHQMERAFNFADNQVLRIYGLRHADLSTSNVKSLHGEYKSRPSDSNIRRFPQMKASEDS